MDYEALRFIWWLLIGVLLIGFAITDGFDMGVAALLKVLGRSNDERRVMINAIAPHWDGNQVWLITAGGALFAAWPTVYAASFSGFYLALMLTLFALFLRPIGFEYRAKIDSYVHPEPPRVTKTHGNNRLQLKKSCTCMCTHTMNMLWAILEAPTYFTTFHQ